MYSFSSSLSEFSSEGEILESVIDADTPIVIVNPTIDEKKEIPLGDTQIVKNLKFNLIRNGKKKSAFLKVW